MKEEETYQETTPRSSQELPIGRSTLQMSPETAERILAILLQERKTILESLACLNVIPQRPLPLEVTVTFVSTVVGGTIATMAQKLGKVGR
jgi:hypothetical protein